MAEPLRSVSKGDPIPLDAGTWNAMIAAGRLVARGGGGGAAPFSSVIDPALTVLVRNDTGGDLDFGAVVRLGAPLASAVDEPVEVQRRPVFPGTAPAASTDPFAVLLEPIAEDEVGRAVVAGVAVCDLVVNSNSHGYAAPGATGGTGALESAGAGPAKIVHKYGSSGTVRAVVLLQGSSADTSPSAGPAAAGCGWLAALRQTDCLEVSVLSESGACDCASTTADKVKLTSSDGLTWSPTGGGGGGGTDCGACATQPDTYAVTLGTGTGSYATVPTSWSLTRGAPASAPCSWYQTQGAWTLTVTYSGGELQAILQGPASAQWITAAPGSCCGALGSVPLDAGGVGAPTCDAVTGTGGTC